MVIMESIPASPGMLTTAVVVLLVESLSLLVLLVNVQIFRTKAAKYRALCSEFGGTSFWGIPGRVLLPLYVLLTIGVTIVSTAFFLWQPHIL